MTEKDRYDTLQKKTAGLDGIESASGGLYSGEIPERRDAQSAQTYAIGLSLFLYRTWVAWDTMRRDRMTPKNSQCLPAEKQNLRGGSLPLDCP